MSSIILLLAAGLSAAAEATPAAGRCWWLVASSDAIVYGRVITTGNSTPQATSTLTLRPEQWLKRVGTARPDAITVVNRRGGGTAIGRPLTASLETLGSESTYDVTPEMEPSCPSLWESPQPVSELLDEVARQARLMAEFPGIAERVRRTKIHGVVRRDIEALVRAKPEDKTARVQRLVSRGMDAVPAMIALLDDDRSVPEGSIEVRVRRSFESTAHYSPTTVFEVVDLVLGQLTDVRFGMADGNDIVRKRILDAWRIYLAYGCPKAAE